jgi:membrane-associated protease RseP (regulator of RpoE activity)
MRYHIPVLAALSLAIAIAVAAPAPAQEWTGKAPTAAQQKALDAARIQLDAAAKRYAELAREYGVERGPVEIRQRLLRKPVIGVLLAPDDQAGVRIAGVTPSSAAAEAGLRSGDRIVAIDGQAIAGADADARIETARAAIAGHDDKSKIELRYLRDGREATIALAPKPGQSMVFIPGMEGMEPGDDLQVMRLPGGGYNIEADKVRGMMPSIAPDIRREIIRLGPGGDCKGEHCKIPVLAEALRWNGLNLASVDPALGRYFGTDKGVLVLSTGPELASLQPGDVVRSVAGKPVASPREVMDALRGRETGSKVAVEYLRDRKPATAQLTVPEPMRLRVPPPPAPPAPPAPPTAAPPAPPAPPIAPLPPLGAAMAPQALQPRSVEKRKIVIVDGDGRTQTWEDDGSAPLPPPPPPPVAPPAPPPAAPPVPPAPPVD